MNPQYLPQILLIYADKTQNRKTTLTIPTCLCLRNNAACCIPLCVICVICGRIHARVLNLYCTNETPMSLADNRRHPPKLQQPHITISNCLSLRNNAACCIPLRDQRYQRENKHARVLNQSTQKKPQCLSQIPQTIADTPNTRQRNPQPYDAACCLT